MASQNRLDQAAGESVNGFFSGTERNQQQEVKETRKNQKPKTITQNIPQTTQKPETASKQSQPNKSIPKGEKSENGENTKQKKQVFSFRAAVKDIVSWKAYAIATGQTMEQIGTVAMNEYLTNHLLTGTEQTIFEAMKAKNENK